MTKTLANLQRRIQLYEARTALLNSRKKSILRKKDDAQAKEIGLWIMKERPDALPGIRKGMEESKQKKKRTKPADKTGGVTAR